MISARRIRSASVSIILALVAGASAQVTSAPGSDPATTPDASGVAINRIGAGVEGIADWSRSAAFVDLIKQARAFGSVQEPYNEKAAVDSDGWPTSDFGVVLFTGLQGLRGTGGVYRISADCRAMPEIQLSSSPGRLMNVSWSPTSARVTADVLFPEGGEQLFLSFQNTGGGARNIRITRPGYSATDVFSRPFLDHMARFGTVRFMNWTSTNGSTIKDWSQRSTPDQARCTGPSGVPWELCAQLCNQLRADMWINVPHMATDDYVERLATLLHSTLDKDRKIYVEYSNELWNFQFAQTEWNKAAALAEVQAGASVLNFDGETNEYYLGWRRTARRLKEISDIFRSVFAEHAAYDRVRPVLAGQIANTEVLRQGLKVCEAAYGPPRNYFYALAGAPYFNLQAVDQKADLTVDQVIAALGASAASLPSEYHYEENIAMARWNGLEYLGYEGGPDTFGPNNVPAKRAANLDPRMADICRGFLTDWFRAGFGELVWYVAGATRWDTEYGTWGLTYDMSVQKTPKIEAVDGVRRSLKIPVTAGIPVPGPVDARHFVGAPADWATRDPYLRTPQASTYNDYLVRVDSAGTYELRIEAASGAKGGQIHALVNTRPIGIMTLPPTGGWEKWGTTHPVTVDLEQGLSVVRLFFVSNQAYNVKQIVIKTR